MLKTTVNDIVNLPLNVLQQWIHSSLAEPHIDKDFNWLGLAEVLAQEVRSTNDINKRIHLAELAVNVYEWLANHGDTDHSDSNTNSAIALMIYMLSNNYVDPRHPSLGENKLSKLLWNDFKFSSSEAGAIAKEFRDKLKDHSHPSTLLKTKELRKLRKIKNKLNLIKNLPSDSKLLAEIKLKGWLEIYEMLP